jgi:hypothetical protein
MSPLFFFNELDKFSDTSKGSEIIRSSTHLTDTSQKSKFHDKYFSEIDFGLSNVYLYSAIMMKLFLIQSFSIESNEIRLKNMMLIKNCNYESIFSTKDNRMRFIYI